MIKENHIFFRVIWDNEGIKIKSRIFRTYEQAEVYAKKRPFAYNVQSLSPLGES